MWVYNNTAYDNNVNYGFTTAYGTNTIQNCISFQSQDTDGYKSQNVVAIDHNSWNNGFSVSASDFQSLDTTQILGYRTSDGSLTEGTCLRLKEGSPLIDAGIDINLGYNGNAPDLGCYEVPGEHHDPIPDDTIPSVQPEGTHAVAFITLIGATEDKALLKHLRANDSLWIVETDATDNEIDYSSYEVLVLGPKPNSGAVGFAALKGYNKPMVLLKPFLLKDGAWGWGTAVNTQDLSVSVSHPEHPLFRGLTISDGHLPLFSQCNTNAVTAISTWTNTTGFTPLASPASQTEYTTVADFPAGSNCNGIVLPQPIVMIGVSEYSTSALTYEGKQLIENAILYLMGIQMPQGIGNQQAEINNHKYIQDGKLFIQAGGYVYDVTGRRIAR